MNMIRCPLLSNLRTRKTSDGPLMIGEDLMSFTILDTVERHEASGAPLSAN
jgi:hypothetical protein